jgi:hypothetical protein
MTFIAFTLYSYVCMIVGNACMIEDGAYVFVSLCRRMGEVFKCLVYGFEQCHILSFVFLALSNETPKYCILYMPL